MQVVNLNKSISGFRNSLAENILGKNHLKYYCSPKGFMSNDK